MKIVQVSSVPLVDAPCSLAVAFQETSRETEPNLLLPKKYYMPLCFRYLWRGPWRARFVAIHPQAQRRGSSRGSVQPRKLHPSGLSRAGLAAKDCPRTLTATTAHRKRKRGKNGAHHAEILVLDRSRTHFSPFGTQPSSCATTDDHLQPHGRGFRDCTGRSLHQSL